jgi:hypothetical protein
MRNAPTTGHPTRSAQSIGQSTPMSSAESTITPFPIARIIP